MLPQALKLKVIQQYEAGKLQKDIAHDLGISTGSVSTILEASRGRQKHEDNSNSNSHSRLAQEKIEKDTNYEVLKNSTTHTKLVILAIHSTITTTDCF
ncbi:MAG: hypothetical protein WB988_21235 [Candidatus Nitrosopolaris sp.]